MTGTDKTGVLENDRRLLQLAPEDNVLVAVMRLEAGESLIIHGRGVTLASGVGLGHKIAGREMARGDKIIKYGAPIGSATQPIAAGQHVHTHNMQSDYIPTYTWGGQQEFFHQES